MASLNKFGTVEFRGMRGLDNREDLQDWLDIVHEFCEYACYTMKNPVTLIEQISVKTPIGFLLDIFSKENFERLTKDVNHQFIEQSIYDGIRLVQMMCYKIGTEFDKVKPKGKDFWASFNTDEPVVEEDAGHKPFFNLRPAAAGGDNVALLDRNLHRQWILDGNGNLIRPRPQAPDVVDDNF
jgi:hypothetical protein